MKNWYMLTLVGKDQAGIVAKVSTALYAAGCNLGEASMLRLGGNFTIMLMVEADHSSEALRELLWPLAKSLSLNLHLSQIEGDLHQHIEPDVQITVYGADRAGIVARVTTALAKAGLNIIDLESKVGGNQQQPIYIMQIEGIAMDGFEALQLAIAAIRKEGVEAQLMPINTMLG
ncbi:MAG: ACT domain-containing protein [Thiohalomonadaceae bacterium]